MYDKPFKLKTLNHLNTEHEIRRNDNDRARTQLYDVLGFHIGNVE